MFDTSSRLGSYRLPSLLIVCCSCLWLPLVSEAFYQLNEFGGECAQIGEWNSQSLTCTLTQDLDEPIIITGPLVTLDGNGYTIDVTEDGADYAVEIRERQSVTVKNLTAVGGGIYANRADDARVRFNTIHDARIGINLFDLAVGVAEGNVVDGSQGLVTFAFSMQDADQLTITNNRVVEVNDAMNLVRVDGLLLEHNTLVSLQSGLDLRSVTNGVVRNNTVRDAEVALRLDADTANANEFSQNIFRDSVLALDIYADDGPGVPTLSWWQSLQDWVLSLAMETAWAQVTSGNVFTGNNFVNNTADVSLVGDADVTFFASLPSGGNYWDRYDEATEGCTDDDDDDFCDFAYQVAPDYTDDFPRATGVEVEEPDVACSDGDDNDSDGLIDYPDDPGCASADDPSEINAPPAPVPTCALAVSPATITEGENATLSWTSTDASDVIIDQDVGEVPATGETTVSPTETTTYTGTFTGSGGEVSCETTVTVESNEPEPLALHEQAALNAIALVDQPDGYLWGGKGWDFELREFVTPATVLSGYQYYNPNSRQVETGIGLDCSGLVAWAYNRAADATQPFTKNFIAYENAAGQATDAQSEPITAEELRPGDTMYFDFGGTGRINHTAMYVGDQGTFDVVNASEPNVGIIDLRVESYSQFLGFQFFRRPQNAQVAMSIQASSPVDLSVTDPDGNTISAETVLITEREFIREIPGELYYSESVQGHDGNPADVVYSPVLKDGQYRIEVEPNADAASDDTYSLTFTAGETVIELAMDDSISELPVAGFVVTVSENGTEIVVDEITPSLDEPAELFALLKEQIESAETNRLLALRLLLNYEIAWRQYQQGRERLAAAVLKHLDRVVERQTDRGISVDAAAKIQATIQRLIQALQND